MGTLLSKVLFGSFFIFLVLSLLHFLTLTFFFYPYTWQSNVCKIVRCWWRYGYFRINIEHSIIFYSISVSKRQKRQFYKNCDSCGNRSDHTSNLDNIRLDNPLEKILWIMIARLYSRLLRKIMRKNKTRKWIMTRINGWKTKICFCADVQNEPYGEQWTIWYNFQGYCKKTQLK